MKLYIVTKCVESTTLDCLAYTDSDIADAVAGCTGGEVQEVDVDQFPFGMRDKVAKALREKIERVDAKIKELNLDKNVLVLTLSTLENT